jgi:cytochrome oxidase Cu insertion factor (SCO1/SenC/PrrC family)
VPESPKRAGEQVVIEQITLAAPVAKEFNIDVLGKNISDILKKFSKVVDGVPGNLGNYKVDNVSVSLAINSEGKVSILGIGGSVGAQAGITVTLKK